MITLHEKSIALIKAELESIPKKYQKTFNSTHEGLSVLREEYLELEKEIYFGEKEVIARFHQDNPIAAAKFHRRRIQIEAVQVAAMAIRIIQELTD